MTVFSSDIDLLRYETVVFETLWLKSQTLAGGTDGVLSAAALTSASADFVSSGIKAGQVVFLTTGDASVEGCFEIVSVDSATQLTVSVLRTASTDAVVSPPEGSAITFRISTFEPQAAEAAESLLSYFGIGDQEGEVALANVLNSEVLRQASVFSVLVSLFISSATGVEDGTGYYEKSLRYQQRFNAARVKVRLALDGDGDGVAETFRRGGSVRLQRG